MGTRSCVYIDGESHYIRSSCEWKLLHGQGSSLSNLCHKGDSDTRNVLVDDKAKVFWTRKLNPSVGRVVYFTSVSCDTPKLHEIQRKLRDFDIEGVVIPEAKQLYRQRASQFANHGIIEKAKRVDISLAVRMMLDAERQLFDVVHLYTSDIDFLPVIQASQSRGVQVIVYGYASGLGSNSEYLHVPDKFIDLACMLKTDCELMQ